MNLFQKYGIKEVADVVFYSIVRIEDEEFYIPALFLDTLKVSTLDKTETKVNNSGGYANKKLIGWNFGRDISLNLEDALFTPASMSMMWGGDLQAKLSPYLSTIAKLSIANKYGRLHYSTKAYPSPPLDEKEIEIVLRAAEEQRTSCGTGSNCWNFTKKDTSAEYVRFWTRYYDKDTQRIEQNRTELKKRYLKRNWYSEHLDDLIKINGEASESLANQSAMPQCILNTIISYVTDFKHFGEIDTNFHDIEVIDRMEKCVVKNKNGLTISTSQQKENLLKFYQDDRSSSYIIYYDAKTMRPLVSITDEGLIKGWNAKEKNQYDKGSLVEGYDRDFDGKIDLDEFTIKAGTVYYKWSRTVKRKAGVDDGILGRTLVIDAETFPNEYRIVGETQIREYKTNQDQKYQFVINRAKVSSDTNITLQADGDPTTFSMSVEVLAPPNGNMIELRQFDVDEDVVHGGTRIVPQKSTYTYTPTTIEPKEIDFTNDEIY